MANIVKYTSDSGQEITLTQGIVAQYIAGNQNVTPQEFMTFAALCKNYGLNPFIREAYMIKYGNQPATIVTGKDVFTKRAYRHPKFQGFQAGITVQNQQGQRLKRKGSAIYEGETVIGGWAEVYLAEYQVPIYDEVSFNEYAARKKDGTLNKTWSSKPGTMIRKVALVHALREAFPEEFNGMYDQSEMGVDEQPDEPIQVPAEIIPEQNQEAAYEYTEEFLMSINIATISGNLTRDAELRQTASGTSVLSFSVAVNERRPDGNGGWTDYPNYIGCIVFGKRAESLSRFLGKGIKVAVQGRLHQSSWEKDGVKRSKVEVVVDQLDLMSQRQSHQQAPQQHQQPAQQAPAQQPVQQQPYQPAMVNVPQQQVAPSMYDEDIPF